jgi:hypothetical protein
MDLTRGAVFFLIVTDLYRLVRWAMCHKLCSRGYAFRLFPLSRLYLRFLNYWPWRRIWIEERYDVSQLSARQDQRRSCG